MLSDDFDQTTDVVYEVWNWNQDADPLMGVFDDEAEADTFEMDQIIETGGGLVHYYPPLERYTDLPPEERAAALATEAIERLERVERELETQFSPEERADVPWPSIEELREAVGEASAHDVELDYDEEAFRNRIAHVALTDLALDVVRAYHTLARVRHLSVYDERMLLGVEVDLRKLHAELTERALRDDEEPK